ncbi:aquaporin-like protein [Eremomyces bilateralis CBS 781.70]|uniref:Aquaporin-like protein n=1 Tax=Eremomyces bilateralis CBS 781.70 TaxID=1392243 RepID=A0A6G1GCB6_9PEZI|nr:aquaporin-like protein [Eremomyces bilateralis CBS 781.70]KAF1815632.1 aquaporin-like protein [Eremomyces bilateralis CBS 781.70]
MAHIAEKHHHDSPTDSTEQFDVPNRSYRVINRPYAGRLGGSQKFTISGTTAERQDLLQKVPDAAPYLRLREALNLRPLRDVELWKQALIEGYATTFFVWATAVPGLVTKNILDGEDDTPLQKMTLHIISHVTLALVVALLVYATAPISGGHMNPMVTIGTFLNGLTSLPRAILYVIAQLIGSTIAAYLIKGMYGRELDRSLWGGCWVDSDVVSPGQAYLLEAVASTFLMYLLYRTALDPHYKHDYGSATGIVLVALSFTTVSFLSWSIIPGTHGGACALVLWL